MSVLPANSVVVYASPEFNADYEHAVMDPPDPDNPWRNGPVFMKTGDAHRLFTESAAFTLPPRDGTGPRLVLPQKRRSRADGRCRWRWVRHDTCVCVRVRGCVRERSNRVARLTRVHFTRHQQHVDAH